MLVLTWIGWIPAGAAAADGDACAYFFAALKAVPHETLSRRNGEHESSLDGKKYRGCEVRFVTTDALRDGRAVPNFEPLPGSETHRLGWRTIDSMTADGPGTGTFGMEKDSTLCVVRWSQPSHVAETGKIVQSKTLRVTVQCRKK